MLGFGFLRLGIVAVWVGLTTVACTGNELKQLSKELGCREIDGLGAVTSQQPPTYILVGETNEAKEAPAAFAELACHLAAQQQEGRLLWVGVPDHTGGTTDAVLAMHRRLDELVSKGAPIVIGNSFAGSSTGASRRSEAERRWADAIGASRHSAGASQALHLLPRRRGLAARAIDPNGRFEDYTPMSLFLPGGQMINLDIAQVDGIGSPTIRIYLQVTDGYMDQIALATVTPAQKAAPRNVLD